MPTPAKTLRFPHRRSVGTLYVAPENQPEEWELLSQVRGLIVTPENNPIKWDLLDEARGTVSVPANVKLKLKVLARGASLAPLNELKEDDLHVLDLGHSDVSDISLAHVRGLTGVRVLELTSTDITDHGLEHVSTLINIQSLGLSHSRVTSRGLPHLQAMNQLRELWMSGTDVNDGGMQSFKFPDTIVQLGLSGTKITDKGLIALNSLKNLLRVYLFNTAVSKDGTEKLKAAVPGCRIKWHPPVAADELARDDRSLRGNAQEFPLIDFSVPVRTLDEKKFWQVISLLDWDKAGDDEAVIEPAVEELASLPTQDIMAFADILSEKLYELDAECFAREIGQDAYDGNKQNFAKQWFLMVRCCVVANGEDLYEEVLENPQAIPKDMEFASLLNVAPEAYRRKTNKKFVYTTAFNYETFSNKKGWSVYGVDASA